MSIILGCGCEASQTVNANDVLNIAAFVLNLLKKYGVLMLVCITLTGCAFIKPTTKITVDPLSKRITVENTKDVDVILEKLYAKWGDNNSLSVEKLVISDKASPVITQNVAQMKEATNQIRETALGFVGVSREIGETVSPWKAVADKAEELGNEISKAYVATHTTTQPAQ